MRLYDTLSNDTIELEIVTNRPLTMYVCGVTPYDTTHIGHARTFLIFDALLRYLRYRGAEVWYCQNVTDVDDPLFERAARDNIAWDVLAQRELEQFVADCRALNMIPPTYFPKASETIAQMIETIERLITLGHGYVRNGNVYFRVSTDPDYGAMARMGYDELLATANQNGNNPDDPDKDDPLDFILWHTGNPGDPTWPSPWGPGRPGWHIECTAMSTKYLGEQIDIHGGGRDLIFPHHPSEIAQTEAVTGKQPFVRVWMHCGLVWLDGEKMSKSLGNMVFARDVIRDHGADPLRWYLLSAPYREDFYYEHAGLLACKEKVERVKAALQVQSPSNGQALDLSSFQSGILSALDDGLQTHHALAQIEELAVAVLAGVAEQRDVRKAQQSLHDMIHMLGFLVNEES